ncbi:cyclin-H1-1 isoform X2 [Manihot esculenta]|uniref:Uncharacterized protein n=1 Tax=Manihot esculenta TaxID=3983 RepID=A0ACB7H8X3_MANES|nr:cyclin-H1-1 isoform X2 [Manihot esculenta]XP_043816408.1 cyclin-H1-1 isoform X2 [Manihot esculenta]KAG8648278.1 hypothetical protein MANES_09G168600v8 [Manihot esculenta]
MDHCHTLKLKPTQQTMLISILVQNHSALMKNNLCECTMNINYEKFAAPFTFLIKFRQLHLYTSKGFIFNGRSWNMIQNMLTCIYAACKIEENHVSAEELGKGISQDHQMILNYEMIVLQSLEFDLIVYAPYRSVEGFINDMEEFCHATDDQIQMLKDMQATAITEVDKILFTDAPLLFPPGQLALAALRIANEMHQVLDFERYLRNILSRQNSVHTISNLTESLDAIDSWVKKYKFPTEKDMKHINRKLKSCWGHSSHDDKKREKKSKHKSHKSSNEMQNGPTLA